MNTHETVIEAGDILGQMVLIFSVTEEPADTMCPVGHGEYATTYGTAKTAKLIGARIGALQLSLPQLVNAIDRADASRWFALVASVENIATEELNND